MVCVRKTKKHLGKNGKTKKVQRGGKIGFHIPKFLKSKSKEMGPIPNSIKGAQTHFNKQRLTNEELIKNHLITSKDRTARILNNPNWKLVVRNEKGNEKGLFHKNITPTMQRFSREALEKIGQQVKDEQDIVNHLIAKPERLARFNYTQNGIKFTSGFAPNITEKINLLSQKGRRRVYEMAQQAVESKSKQQENLPPPLPPTLPPPLPPPRRTASTASTAKKPKEIIYADLQFPNQEKLQPQPVSNSVIYSSLQVPEISPSPSPSPKQSHNIYSTVVRKAQSAEQQSQSLPLTPRVYTPPPY
jgi:hypothetical protein